MWVVVILVVVVGLFLSGFFSGAETGLYRVNRLRLQLGTQQGDASATRLAGILVDEQGALSVTLIGTNIANYVTTSAVAFLFAEMIGVNEAATEIYTVALVTPVIFVFGEMVPKNLFRLHADVLMARGGGLLAASNRLCRMSGLVAGLSQLVRLAHRLTRSGDATGDPDSPKRRVALMLQEALAGSSHYEEHSDLIERVCQLSETPIHTVMIPRNRVKVISVDAERKDLIRIARRTRHGRLPVYSATPSSVVGVVRVDTLLRDGRWRTVGDRMKRAITLSPHETVARAMKSLQQAGRGMAVVTDRGGQMLGIVTLKDLLQEAVGELAPGV